MKLENNLGTDAIRPLVLRIAIPSMLAQFVSVLYSMAFLMRMRSRPPARTSRAGRAVIGCSRNSSAIRALNCSSVASRGWSRDSQA